MRLPELPPLPPPPAEDLYEIRERPPVAGSPFVQARSLPPLIVPPRRSQPRERNRQPPTQGGRPETAQFDEDRRTEDRRKTQLPVLLDTRTGRERRQHADGDDDAVQGVDIEA